ncbi:MAG: acyl-CoA dehydrogenase family protein, partial [Pseudomonadota bacterium]
MAELGWTATTIPESYGGLGLSYLELCVIAEELGRVVAPVPFSSSVYLATEALLLYGSDAQKDKWLPKLAEGSVIGCFGTAEQAGHAAQSETSCKVDGNGLNGQKIAVVDGDIADFAIVTVTDGSGTSQYLVELGGSGVSREVVSTLDPSRSHATLSFDGADAELLGTAGAGQVQVDTLHNRAAVLFAWEQVGGSKTALDMAKAYAMDRYAFGRPIAGYQAIKHKLASIYVKTTLAESNSYYGAWALNTDSEELPLAAATARVAGIQAYQFAAAENIQTHGGMGFTWEFDCQFPYRRAKLLAMTIGGELVWQKKLVSALRTAA